MANKLAKLESDVLIEKQKKALKMKDKRAKSQKQNILEPEPMLPLAEIRKLILPSYSAENCPEFRSALPCLKTLNERELYNPSNKKKEKIIKFVSPFRHYCGFKKHEKKKEGFGANYTPISRTETYWASTTKSTSNSPAKGQCTPHRIITSPSIEDLQATVRRAGPFLTEFQMSLNDQKVN
jgi:hypothetical protein